MIMNRKHQHQSQQTSVLVVANQEPPCSQLGDLLAQAGLQITHTPCPHQAAKALQTPTYSAAIIHQNTAPDTLTHFCQTARSANEQLTIIAILTHHDEELETALFASGVDDVVTDHHTPQAITKRLTTRLRHKKT
jgi:PleD family two-component response regulator